MMNSSSLDRKSVPLYIQLEQIIKSKVLKGEFLPGDKIPTEKELCETYQVSTITVRQAILSLVKEGLLHRKQGKGTYISNTEIPSTQKIKFTGNIEGFIRKGLKLNKIEVLSIEETIPLLKITQALNLKKDQKVIKIIRRGGVDDVPVAYLNSYLPLELGAVIHESDLKNYSLLQLLRNKFKIPIISGTHNIEAASADYDVANMLDLEMFSPILYAELHMFTLDNKPVEFTQAFFRPDRFVYSLELNFDEFK